MNKIKFKKPVIENAYFKKHVFHTALFKLQEMLHISAVIFPTVEGKVYGFSVYQFETLAEAYRTRKEISSVTVPSELQKFIP